MSYHASYRSETHCMHVCACVRARAREILTWFRLRGAVMGRSSRDNGFAGSNGIWLARKIDSIVARDPGETFYGSAFIAEFIPPGYWISRPRVSGLKPACANTENTSRRGEAHNGLAAHVSPRGFFFFLTQPNRSNFLTGCALACPCFVAHLSTETNPKDIPFEEKRRPVVLLYSILSDTLLLFTEWNCR